MPGCAIAAPDSQKVLVVPEVSGPKQASTCEYFQREDGYQGRISGVRVQSREHFCVLDDPGGTDCISLLKTPTTISIQCLLEFLSLLYLFFDDLHRKKVADL